jgi:hypothetical protein
MNIIHKYVATYYREEFEWTEFNSVELLKSGYEHKHYINVTQSFRLPLHDAIDTEAFNTETKTFADLIKTQQWKREEGFFDKCNSYDKAYGPFFELNNIRYDIRGIYVHPGFVHTVISFFCPEYRYKVSEIMDQCNEKNRMLNQTLSDTKASLNKEITEVGHAFFARVLDD